MHRQRDHRTARAEAHVGLINIDDPVEMRDRLLPKQRRLDDRVHRRRRSNREGQREHRERDIERRSAETTKGAADIVAQKAHRMLSFSERRDRHTHNAYDRRQAAREGVHTCDGL